MDKFKNSFILLVFRIKIENYLIGMCNVQDFSLIKKVGKMKRRKTEWIRKLREFRTKLSGRTVAALFLKPKLSNIKIFKFYSFVEFYTCTKKWFYS